MKGTRLVMRQSEYIGELKLPECTESEDALLRGRKAFYETASKQQFIDTLEKVYLQSEKYRKYIEELEQEGKFLTHLYKCQVANRKQSYKDNTRTIENLQSELGKAYIDIDKKDEEIEYLKSIIETLSQAIKLASDRIDRPVCVNPIHHDILRIMPATCCVSVL